MKVVKIGSTVAGCVLLLLAAMALAAYLLFDPVKVKTEISHAIQAKYQRHSDIGDVKLSFWPNLGLRVEKLAISEHNSQAPFLSLDSARIAVAVIPLLSRHLAINSLEINGLQATLIKHKDGTLSISDLLGESPPAAKKPVNETLTKVPPPAVVVDIDSIKIANAQLTWRDEKAGTTTVLSNLDLATDRVQADSAKQTLALKALRIAARGKFATDSFELTLFAPALHISPTLSMGERLSFSATISGNERNATAQLILSGLAGNSQSVTIAKLDFELAGKLGTPAGEAKFQAKLVSPVAADIGNKSVSLEALSGSLYLAHPGMPMKELKLPLTGSAKANVSQQTASLNIATSLDDSKIASKLDVQKFEPLALAFDIDINQLNLDKYLPPAPANQKESAKTSPNKSSADTVDEKVDLSALKSLNVVGAIRVGGLQAKRIKLSNLSAKIALSGGRLAVAPLTLNLYDGAASGSLTVNAHDNAIAFKQNLSNVSVGPLIKDLAEKDVIDGRGNIMMDLTTTGPTILALKRALAGTASLSLKDGAVKGFNVAKSLRELKSSVGANSSGGTQQANNSEKTDFSELTASFKLARGVAHNDDLSLKSPFLRLTGAGDVDIVGTNGLGQMNYLAKASVVGSAAGQGGKSADQLSGLTIPVRISGPFNNLSYKLELGSMVSDTAKAKLEEKKQEIKTKVEDQVKDKLKGLFGK